MARVLNVPMDGTNPKVRKLRVRQALFYREQQDREVHTVKLKKDWSSYTIIVTESQDIKSFRKLCLKSLGVSDYYKLHACIGGDRHDVVTIVDGDRPDNDTVIIGARNAMTIEGRFEETDNLLHAVSTVGADRPGSFLFFSFRPDDVPGFPNQPAIDNGDEEDQEVEGVEITEAYEGEGQEEDDFEGEETTEEGENTQGQP